METITIWDVPTPEKVPNPDFSKLIEVCEEYIKAVELDSEDLMKNPLRHYWTLLHSKHYIFEAALEAIFGENVWEFVNERSL